jgi:polysaccharide deacetylase 2 family uncharacterized protein YibQ
VQDAAGRPRIALIIDDFGVDKKRSWRTIALKGPLTLSFRAYASDLPQAARRAAGQAPPAPSGVLLV